jgi:hypothetical protein
MVNCFDHPAGSILGSRHPQPSIEGCRSAYKKHQRNNNNSSYQHYQCEAMEIQTFVEKIVRCIPLNARSLAGTLPSGLLFANAGLCAGFEPGSISI